MYMYTARLILAHRCGDEIHSNSGCFDGVPTRDDDDDDDDDDQQEQEQQEE